MSDGGAIDGRSVPGPEGPRVLLFSMRNLARHVSRCGSYEFEGVVAECGNVDVVAPRRRPQRGSPLVRYARRVLGLDSPIVDDDVHPGRDYDLFVAFVRSVKDLRHVERLLGRSGRCRTSVCILDELRPEAIDRSPHGMEVLGRFDCIFSGIHDSVTVEIPLASRIRCTSPTDRAQNGQTGTRAAASTPSSRMAAAMAGAVFSTSSVGSRMYPMVE